MKNVVVNTNLGILRAYCFHCGFYYDDEMIIDNVSVRSASRLHVFDTGHDVVVCSSFETFYSLKEKRKGVIKCN